MISASLEKDYSLCFDEQFTVKRLNTGKQDARNGLNDQSSSILTSICLDLESIDPMSQSIASSVAATNSIPYDASLMDSEMFFQENENEPNGDFNFTKISDLLDDPEIFGDRHPFTKSNQTLDELTNNRTLQDTTISKASNAPEMETVKHKLTSLWNNVKYGGLS
jgi:hypothetical protein